MLTRTASAGLPARSVSVSSIPEQNAIADILIVGDEITILGSFSETYKFPAAIDYLDRGKVKVSGIVNKTFKLEQWGECLEAMRNKSAIKAAITFD